jgi:hypothetical protein
MTGHTLPSEINVKRKMRRGRRIWTVLFSSAMSVVVAPAYSASPIPEMQSSIDVASFVDYTTELVFGNRDRIPPLADIEVINLIVMEDGKCITRGDDFQKQFVVTTYVRTSYSTKCNLSFSQMYHYSTNPPVGKISFLLAVDLRSSKLPSSLVRSTHAVPVGDGFFGRSAKHCRLFVGRDELRRANLVVLQMTSKGPQLFDIDNDQQQECLVRGVLTGLGLQGAAMLPFEFFAARSSDRWWQSRISDGLCTGRRYYCEGGIGYKAPFELLMYLKELGFLKTMSRSPLIRREDWRATITGYQGTPYIARGFSSREKWPDEDAKKPIPPLMTIDRSR